MKTTYFLSLIMIFAISTLSAEHTYAKATTKKQAISHLKKKKITQIHFAKGEKSTIRKPSSVDKALTRNFKTKKVVGYNHDPKHPELTFDPVPSGKAKIVTGRMPDKKPLSRDPALDNPIVVGVNTKKPKPKSDIELIHAFQESANKKLATEFLEESL
jgi:hypothetical protein